MPASCSRLAPTHPPLHLLLTRRLPADDPRTKATWQRLGFSFADAEQLQKMGVTHHDLLHMDNTVQVRCLLYSTSHFSLACLLACLRAR